uniref:Uncharacterized protein n=1 Tax=Sphaerodactylus townsendi TaxID=933632 RepID=A0ACB8FDL5_9SAUR
MVRQNLILNNWQQLKMSVQRPLCTIAEASVSESAEEEAVAGPSGTHSMAEASNSEFGVEEAVAGPSEVQPIQEDLEPEASAVDTGSGPGAQGIPEEATPGMETATPKPLPDPSSVLPQYPVVQSGDGPSAPTSLNPENNAEGSCRVT